MDEQFGSTEPVSVHGLVCEMHEQFEAGRGATSSAPSQRGGGKYVDIVACGEHEVFLPGAGVK